MLRRLYNRVTGKQYEPSEPYNEELQADIIKQQKCIKNAITIKTATGQPWSTIGESAQKQIIDNCGKKEKSKVTSEEKDLTTGPTSSHPSQTMEECEDAGKTLYKLSGKYLDTMAEGKKTEIQNEIKEACKKKLRWGGKSSKKRKLSKKSKSVRKRKSTRKNKRSSRK